MMVSPIARIHHPVLLLAIAALAGAAAPTSPPDHATRGRAAMNPDFPGLRNLCDNVWQSLPAVRAERPWTMPELIPAGMAFENLVFLGNRAVSSWAIKTSAGLILIDALNNEAEARESIEGGLRRLGLDPADIRYIGAVRLTWQREGGAGS